MPYKILKRKCKQSSGKKGNYIVVKKTDNKKQSCHTSKQKAQSAVKARYANENMLKQYIKIIIEDDNQNNFDNILNDEIKKIDKKDKEKEEKEKDLKDF